MEPLYPLMFEPRFKERVWGGRRLATLYGKHLPPDVPIGESWEVSDRPGDESVIANGPLVGRTLHSLLQERRADVLGAVLPTHDGRFPLLCKILDARQKLSLQVHPPQQAKDMGDPKTEMWYIAEADPGADLFVGLKRGVDRRTFEHAIGDGRVAECFHRIEVKSGDAMFLPSGRVHAIGAGLVIFEIQQNSDTTFRVHDWDRVGLDGKPRELHVEQSLKSIDFDDVEPGLIQAPVTRRAGLAVRPLVDHSLFRAMLIDAEAGGELRPSPGQFRVLAVTAGAISVRGGGMSETLRAGDFCLLPAGLEDTSVDAAAGSRFLSIELPDAKPAGA